MVEAVTDAAAAAVDVPSFSGVLCIIFLTNWEIGGARWGWG